MLSNDGVPNSILYEKLSIETNFEDIFFEKACFAGAMPSFLGTRLSAGRW
jgi:hypothetical protein